MIGQGSHPISKPLTHKYIIWSQTVLFILGKSLSSNIISSSMSATPAITIESFISWPWCFCMCVFKFPFWEKSLPHVPHLKGFCSRCMFLCSAKVPMFWKDFSQTSHWFVNSMCDLMCFLNLFWVRKLLLHFPQGNPPPSTCVFPCLSSFSSDTKFLLHSWHL